MLFAEIYILSCPLVMSLSGQSLQCVLCLCVGYVSVRLMSVARFYKCLSYSSASAWVMPVSYLCQCLGYISVLFVLVSWQFQCLCNVTVWAKSVSGLY